jgi:hypothetical protein
MIRALRIWILRQREASLLAQIEHGQALLLQHRASLIAAHGSLRRVRMELATKESPRKMVADAMRRTAGVRF